MAVADTVVVDGGEAETGPKSAIGMEMPLAEVAVPPRLHFADEHNFLALDVDTDAQEIAGVRARVEDGFGGRVAKPETRCWRRPKIDPVCRLKNDPGTKAVVAPNSHG